MLPGRRGTDYGALPKTPVELPRWLDVVVLPLVYLVVRSTEGGWGPISRTLLRRVTFDLAARC